MKHYDSIVVGGGIAGMSVAALLALDDRRVLLVERSSRVGGLVQTIHYDGVEFPVGAHHLSGSRKNGLVVRILERLGISTDQLLVPIRQMDVRLDGILYTIPLSVDDLADFIRREFPQEERFGEFIKELRRYCAYYMGNNEDDLLRFFKETASLAFDAYLDRYFQSPCLKRLLSFLGPTYGGLEYHDSAFSHLSLLVSYFCGTCYVSSGIQTLIRQLATCLDRLQVDILLHTQYESVIQDGFRVVGINCYNRITNEQLALTAENVVLTIDPSVTLLNRFPAIRVCRKIEELRPGPTVIRMVGTVSRVMDDVKCSDIACIGEKRSVMFELDCECLPMYMLCYPEMAGGNMPKGQTSFMLTFLTRTATDLSVQTLKRQILILLERFVPDFYATIKSCCVLPTGVYRQLSGHPTGAAFGWTRNERSTMHTNAFAPCVSGVQNLYVCGNWSTDFGLYGALRSAERVAQVIRKRQQNV
ncbi:phytoene desaturase family protein [Ruminococcus sp.]